MQGLGNFKILAYFAIHFRQVGFYVVESEIHIQMALAKKSSGDARELFESLDYIYNLAADEVILPLADVDRG
ncbi:MAG: hypothetical protein AAB389_02915 [Patescibacteria group bacterium]